MSVRAATGGVRAAVGFLTPLGGASAPTPAAVAWFPAVGAAMGLVLGGWWWLVARAWPAPVAAVLVVIADLAFTGMLHVDGLLDSADGLLPHLERSRRLEVMSAPEVGAFAVAVGGATLVARWASLSALRPAPLLLAALWCASRTLMAAALRYMPYARETGGLATAFLDPPGPAGSAVAPDSAIPPGSSGSASHLVSPGSADSAVPPGSSGSAGRRRPHWPALVVLVVGGVGAVALAAAWRTVAGPVAVVSGVAAGVGVVLLARRKLGGFTGDVLGAAGVVAETVGLIVASAKWTGRW